MKLKYTPEERRKRHLERNRKYYTPEFIARRKKRIEDRRLVPKFAIRPSTSDSSPARSESSRHPSSTQPKASSVRPKK